MTSEQLERWELAVEAARGRMVGGAWIEFSRPRPEQSPLRERPRTREEVEAMGFVLSVDDAPRKMTS